jgi:hypothetical protein
MNTPNKNHYVAQFYLNGWCRHDGRLAVYSQKNDKLVIDWHTPEYTAFEPHLYKISALPSEDQQWAETEIMKKAVDDPAAKVLHRLRQGKLKELSPSERADWTRFILAQWMRSPENIAELRRMGREVLLRELETNPEEYQAILGDSPHATLQEWVNAHIPGLDEMVAMGRVLPKMITDADAGNIIIRMLWQVLDLSGSKMDLLTGDQPVVRLGGLKSNDCLIAIPLDRQRLFIASHYDRSFEQFKPERVARASNKEIVSKARRRVFASGTHHRPLVEKLLSRNASDEQKAST